jgi:hypothetical protein
MDVSRALFSAETDPDPDPDPNTQATKAQQRNAAEAVLQASSKGANIPDEGWPIEFAAGDGECMFTPHALWDGRLPASIMAESGVPRAAVAAAPHKLGRHSAAYAPVEAVSIQRIAAVDHPACGQHGLFAARYIPPRTHVVDYAGFVTNEALCSTTSDYILRLTGVLSVDAERCGNQSRFINDFRGVAKRANVELVLSDSQVPTMQVRFPHPHSTHTTHTLRDAHTVFYLLSWILMLILSGVCNLSPLSSDTHFSLPPSSWILTCYLFLLSSSSSFQVWTASVGVEAGTELLLSYGKGFWHARR